MSKLKKKPLSAFVQLNFFEAEAAKNAGIQQAVDNAEKHSDKWVDKACEFTKLWLLKNPHPFFFEQVRAAAESVVPAPPHERAWGGVAKKLSMQKLIKRVGYGNTSNVKAHCTPASIWQRV